MSSTRRGRDRPPKRCRKCDQQVLWWRNANRDGSICVDLSSDESGTVQKLVTTEDGQPVVWGKKLAGRDLADAVSNGVMLFTLHANTCAADRARNPRPEGLQIHRPKGTR